MKKIVFISLFFGSIINASEAENDFYDLKSQGYFKGLEFNHLQQLTKMCRNGNDLSCATLSVSLIELNTLCTAKLNINASREEFAKRNFACPRYLTLLHQFGIHGLAVQVEVVIEDTLIKSLEKMRNDR